MISSKAVPEDLNLKFRSKFNYGFAILDCLHRAFLKARYSLAIWLAIVLKKNCFAVLKLKLQLKLRFKMLYLLLKLLHAAFVLNTTTKMACFA